MGVKTDMATRVKRGHGYMYKCDYCGAIHHTATHANECCNAFKHMYKKSKGQNVLKSTGLKWR